MKIHKLTETRLQKINKHNIPIEFMSNIMEENKNIVDLIPFIKNIDMKIEKHCEDVFEKMNKINKK